MITTRPRGMAAFTIVWFGQVVSLLGTTMTQFALTIWAWQSTGSAEALALVGFFTFAPTILISPLAGALVDRWNRRFAMMISDLAAALASTAVLVLYATGQLQIWHLFVTGMLTGTFQAFQWPAYSAAISTMLPKEQYVRADSMLGLAETGAGVLAPVLASLLLSVIHVDGILIFDLLSFAVAVTTLLLVVIPQPPASAEGLQGRGSLWQESLYGFRFILSRPSLLGLQLVFFAGNLVGSLGWTVLTPMVLTRTADNATALGLVQSAGAVGGVVGGLILSAWGGLKRRVHGVLAGHIWLGATGYVLLGLGRALPVWLAANFLATLVIPLVNGSNQAIWQAKVPPDVQGRVFSVRRMIAQISAPVGILLGGVLAQRVFEPAMAAGGPLSPALGWLVGTGPGAGMALLLVLSGVATVAAGIAGYASPAIREVETRLPDHEPRAEA